MKKQLDDVRQFMRAAGLPCRSKPVNPPPKEAQLALQILASEISEYAQAAAAGDVVEVADAVVDMVYASLYISHTYGFAPVLEELWDEVQRTQLNKILPDGTVVKDASGKIAKPEGWTKPDLESIVKRAQRPKFGRPPG